MILSVRVFLILLVPLLVQGVLPTHHGPGDLLWPPVGYNFHHMLPTPPIVKQVQVAHDDPCRLPRGTVFRVLLSDASITMSIDGTYQVLSNVIAIVERGDHDDIVLLPRHATVHISPNTHIHAPTGVQMISPHDQDRIWGQCEVGYEHQVKVYRANGKQIPDSDMYLLHCFDGTLWLFGTSRAQAGLRRPR